MKIAAGILSGTKRRKENLRLRKNGANLFGFRGGKSENENIIWQRRRRKWEKLLADLCSRIRRMLLGRPGSEEAEARIMIRFATCSTMHASSSQLTHLHTSASQMKISLLKIKLFSGGQRKLRRAHCFITWADAGTFFIYVAMAFSILAPSGGVSRAVGDEIFYYQRTLRGLVGNIFIYLSVNLLIFIPSSLRFFQQSITWENRKKVFGLFSSFSPFFPLTTTKFNYSRPDFPHRFSTNKRTSIDEQNYRSTRENKISICPLKR